MLRGMQPPRDIRLTLDADLILAIGRAARDAGVAPSELVAGVLAAHFPPPSAPAVTAPALPPDLRAIFRSAAGWIELQQRLRRAGLVLRCDGGGTVSLHNWPQDRPLAPLEALGLSAEALALRFRAPFPGHVASRPSRGGKAA